MIHYDYENERQAEKCDNESMPDESQAEKALNNIYGIDLTVNPKRDYMAQKRRDDMLFDRVNGRGYLLANEVY